jgi:hypothetical protein
VTRTQRRRGRRASLPRRLAALVVLVLLSFLHICLAAFLILFGMIAGWDADAGRPVIGVLLILAGVAIFILGPRVIRRLTGREPITPPPYV